MRTARPYSDCRAASVEPEPGEAAGSAFQRRRQVSCPAGGDLVEIGDDRLSTLKRQSSCLRGRSFERDASEKAEKSRVAM